MESLEFIDIKEATEAAIFFLPSSDNDVSDSHPRRNEKSTSFAATELFKADLASLM